MLTSVKQSISASFANTCQIDFRGRMNCWGSKDTKINEHENYTNKFNNKFVEVGVIHACAQSQKNQLNSDNIEYQAQCWGVNQKGGNDIDDEKVHAQFRLGFGQTCSIIIPSNEQIQKYSQDLMNLVECVGEFVIDKKFDQKDLLDSLAYNVVQLSHNLYGQCDIPTSINTEIDSYFDSMYVFESEILSERESEFIPSSEDMIFYLAAGQKHSCSLYLNKNRILCWGSNDKDQLTTSKGIYKPLQQTIIAGFDHSCAILMIGYTCWGSNDANQALGDLFFRKKNNKGITAGGQHNCLVYGEADFENKHDKVYCYGLGKDGQCDVPREFK